MAFSRAVDAARSIVRVTASGDSDIATSVVEINATANDLAANPGFGLLVDVSGSTNMPTLAEVRTIIETIKLRKSAFAVGIAFVVRSAVQFGVGRMASIVGDLRGLRIDVFRSTADAEAWLAEGRQRSGQAGAPRG